MTLSRDVSRAVQRVDVALNVAMACAGGAGVRGRERYADAPLWVPQDHERDRPAEQLGVQVEAPG